MRWDESWDRETLIEKKHYDLKPFLSTKRERCQMFKIMYLFLARNTH
jgi:hypothetical protein